MKRGGFQEVSSNLIIRIFHEFVERIDKLSRGPLAANSEPREKFDYPFLKLITEWLLPVNWL